MKRFSLLFALFFVGVAEQVHGQVCPNPIPTLIAPSNGATVLDSPVTFQWSQTPGAIGYYVWASLDGEGFVQIGRAIGNSFQAEIPHDTDVEWYVEAVFGTCNTQSARFTFTTSLCEAPATTLIAPQNFTSVTSPVEFRWSDVPSASGYRLWLVTEVESDDPQFYVLDETFRTSSSVRIPPDIYAWFVETIFEECDSGISEIFLFEVPRSPNCPVAPPTLVSPVGGVNATSPVTLRWNPVPGAIGYQVWAAYEEDEEYQFVEETVATSSEVFVGPGTLVWVIVAQFNGCDDIVSEPGFFTVPYDPACDRGVPYAISPPDGSADVPTRVSFIWTPVDRARKYKVHISVNGGEAQEIGETTSTRLTANVPAGEIYWAVEVEFEDCPGDISAVSVFEASPVAGCRAPQAPDVYVDPEGSSGDDYVLIWSPGLNTASYEIQEATKEDFSNATTRSTTDILLFIRQNVTVPTRYYYRVRSQSDCGLGIGPYSDVAPIVVQPDTAIPASDAELSTSYGTQRVVVQKVHIPGVNGSIAGKTMLATTYHASTDKPWLTVEPSSFTLPPEGIDLTVTADPRNLPVGSNTATIILTTTTSNGSTSVPVSVNLVTPVTPNAGTTPQPNSLIIPAVAHVAGGATFESDVRVANVSTQVMKYLLNFTPTLSDGTKEGQQATIQLEPGETSALNDILKNFFGFSTASESISGVLEIRPLQGSSSATTNPVNVTYASSRTFAIGAQGTFGQYVPAIPFSQFIGKDRTVTLQQVAASAKYRTNLGLVEAAGEPASVVVSVFGDRGERLGDFPFDLRPGEHMQLNRFMESRGLSVNDGRIEVKVLSSTGKVTAYASVLDNATSDPLLVLPVDAAQVNATRYIVPGAADLSTGSARWRTDLRVYNAAAAADVKLTYIPQGASDGPSVSRTVAAGEVLALDNALNATFGVTNSGGSILVTTPRSSKLVVTARTYNDTGSGTYGQFIPGVTVGDGVGLGERPLQILQVEESDRFRTNLGIVELTGNPATVEISAFIPDSKVAVKTQLGLAPNQFIQINRVLAGLGLPTTYNARITVKVIGGSGKVSGYASLIDNRTQDPTYVPAQ